MRAWVRHEARRRSVRDAWRQFGMSADVSDSARCSASSEVSRRAGTTEALAGTRDSCRRHGSPPVLDQLPRPQHPKPWAWKSARGHHPLNGSAGAPTPLPTRRILARRTEHAGRNGQRPPPRALETTATRARNHRHARPKLPPRPPETTATAPDTTVRGPGTTAMPAWDPPDACVGGWGHPAPVHRAVRLSQQEPRRSRSV